MTTLWFEQIKAGMRRTFAQAPATTRFWEVDALRGVAIIMMIIFHLMWDLWFFRILPDVVLWEGFWKYFQRTTASLFIFLVGVSLSLSYRRAAGYFASQRAAQVVDKPKHKKAHKARANASTAPTVNQSAPRGLLAKFFGRGLRIFAIGLVISLGVWLGGTGYIHFGVLHLIGFSIAFAYPFLRLGKANIGLWLLFNLVGYVLLDMRVPTLWFVWLGLVPLGYAPVDFFPVFPWFGVVLLGIGVGNLFYTRQGRVIELPDLAPLAPIRVLSFLGKRSLLIYVIHQPALLGILYLLGLI
ncbi:MAG: heparan-alpha-glucosaminide N-acetyltransferase [Litorilinea sp.]